ncbi:serine--tRNA ligase, partial [Corynebacterium jeddahense]
MIDLKRVRENPEEVRASQRARGEDPALVDELLAADEARRSAIQAADELRAEQKAFGKKIGQATPEERPALLEGSNELKARVKEAEAAQAEAEEKVSKLQYSIGNVIEGAPAGGEEDFIVLEHVGEVPEFDFEVKDHLDLGEALGIIDMKRGTKVGGARFYYLVGDGAWMQLGMLMLAAQKAREAGFKVVIPPVLVRPEIMAGTGFLDQHDEEIYYLERDDMYLVGTSEVALAGLHQDEIIDLSDGPLLYAGWSSCFRREAGSYGKDTKGILRVHQFDKLEMFVYCKPEDAEAMHQKLLGLEREMLAAVEVPYRVIDVAAGDLGSSAA